MKMKNPNSESAQTMKLIRTELKNKFPSVTFSVQQKKVKNDTYVNVTWVNGPTRNEVEKSIEKFDNWSTYSIDGILYERKYTETFLFSVLLQFAAKNNLPAKFAGIEGNENDAHYAYKSGNYYRFQDLRNMLSALNGKYIKDMYAERETPEQKAEKAAKERIQKEKEDAEKEARYQKQQEEYVNRIRREEEEKIKREQERAKEHAEKKEKEEQERTDKQDYYNKQKNQNWDTSGNGKSEKNSGSGWGENGNPFEDFFKNYGRQYQDQHKTTDSKKPLSATISKPAALHYMSLPENATQEQIKSRFKQMLREGHADVNGGKTVVNGIKFDADYLVKVKECALRK
jgi:flagellar biosynthesis GTPase FlhF